LLKELREEAGLSASMMASRIRISREKYDAYERQGPSIPVGILYLISHYLGMTVKVLLSGGKIPMEATITCHSNGEIRFERGEAKDGQAEPMECLEKIQEKKPDKGVVMAVEPENEFRGGKTVSSIGGELPSSKKIEKDKEDDMVFKFKDFLQAIPQRGIIDWQRSYSTNIDFYDKEHREFISMVNELYNAHTAGWKYSQDVFKKVIRWSWGHLQKLRNEETMMERVKYPARNVHRKEHIAFYKEVLRQAKIMNAGKIPDVGEFVLFSREWMASHVGISDRDFGYYLVRLKRRGTLRDIIVKVKQTDRGIIIR
jgi:hemerythrin-like metal-binding protein